MNPLKREYKELYEAELTKRGELNDAISQPITIITAFGAALLFVFSGFTNPFSYVHIVETLIGIIVTFLMGDAIYSLAHSHHDHEYAYTPTPVQLEDYRLSLNDYYAGEKIAADQIDDKVLSYIYEAYIQAASRNAQVNQLRSAYLYDARKALVRALPLVLLLGALKIGTDYFALLQ
ncbi:hypothetical protein [Hyphomicrobium sp. 2TAF46]|uniref:hypothetical protein n=1 Tax=Hyphomicrobium sp. 2TAF46 TaxID=3233019 RepID=UPI003F914192